MLSWPGAEVPGVLQYRRRDEGPAACRRIGAPHRRRNRSDQRRAGRIESGTAGSLHRQESQRMPLSRAWATALLRRSASSLR